MRSFRTLAAVAAAAVVWGGVAYAAPPAMEQSPSVPGALPSVAQIPAPDSPALALAQRYLTMMHFQAAVQKGMDRVVPMIVRLATQASKVMTETQRAALMQSAEETIAEYLPRIQQRAAEVIATQYTTEELTALVTFYDSPIGRRIADKSLDLQQLTSESLRDLGPQIGREMIARFCKKTACPPALKAITPNAS